MNELALHPAAPELEGFAQNRVEIQLEELPEAVVESIMQAYPDAIFLDAELITAMDGSVSAYAVEIEDDDVELEIHLDPNGTILDSELETDTGEAE